MPKWRGEVERIVDIDEARSSILTTAHMKKLHRSNANKILAGIIGGIGEYFDVDPVILRLGWLLIVISTGLVPGIIVYLLAIYIIPRKPG